MISRTRMPRRRRGLTLIEVALSLAVIAMILVGLSQLMANGAEYLRSRTVADRIEQVKAASKSYVQANFAELMQLTGAGGAINVPITGAAGPGLGLPSVQGGGYLASTFVNQNAYNQTHGLVVRGIDSDGNGSADRLEGVVTTIGGIPIPDRVLGQIAGFMGADGGFMFSNPLAGTANQITGVAGGWRTPAATWTVGATAPTTGHVMASMAFNEGILVGDYLNRHDIGIPEANTMRTNLNMGLNQVDDVTQLNNGTTSVALAPAAAVADSEVVVSPNLKVQPAVVAGVEVGGTATAKSFVDLDDVSYFADPASKSVLADVDADMISTDALIYNSDSAVGSVRLRDRLPNYVSKQGWLVTASGQAVAKPTCSNGGQPKITFAAISDSYEFATNVSYGSSMNANGVPSLRNNNLAIARKYHVTNSGSNWIVAVQGTNTYSGIFSGLAMTYCYYPD